MGLELGNKDSTKRTMRLGLLDQTLLEATILHNF